MLLLYLIYEMIAKTFFTDAQLVGAHRGLKSFTGKTEHIRSNSQTRKQPTVLHKGGLFLIQKNQLIVGLISK